TCALPISGLPQFVPSRRFSRADALTIVTACCSQVDQSSHNYALGWPCSAHVRQAKLTTPNGLPDPVGIVHIQGDLLRRREQTSRPARIGMCAPGGRSKPQASSTPLGRLTSRDSGFGARMSSPESGGGETPLLRRPASIFARDPHQRRGRWTRRR